jgi:hypothetical protein
MKLVMLYRPDSEFARTVETYVHDFERSKREEIQLISLDTREGADLAELYDIVQYPALLARRDNGELLKAWQGPYLPLMNEVAGYID